MRFIVPFVAAGLASAGLLETVIKRDDYWGGSVSLGPSKSTIINAVTTLIPGPAPPTQNGVLFLWPGMSNGTGDLVQTTLESWSSNAWCGATTGQWCVRASVFGSFGQLDGTGSPVSGTDEVRIEYNLESDGQTWTQYGTGTECDNSCSGTIAAQKYLNTVITLAEADATFGSTISSAGGATYTEVMSSQGGKAWTIKEIDIPSMH
ncbi:hypothetical protein PDIG_50070 [Penicillium digitatum PHI26]|uniref:Uncharacterized protein n=2 Tax=Penicillium digitatum TaxID=36651 RepID=K9FQN0_PEND2|nr:hypothetical protein PDIP_19310 [Penicillium digitatum Pd1]EKV11474.1 hypothetical protein PDIG_50070 [Penicillium digitatum PHI26]EKV20152.1 hypothetical protein PDIP_19310 [Penicillium digitatum Pd1]KAG0153409.1 hypothetical protein PDIDSM_5262 [Penicillium digitatum]